MVSESLQEVLHAAARGENLTCAMFNKAYSAKPEVT